MKEQLRKDFLSKRNTLTENQRQEKSHLIIASLLKSDEYKKAEYIFTYINMGSEVKTIPFIEQAWKDGKKIAVPIAKKNRLMYFVKITTFDCMKRTSIGVMEPDIAIEYQVLPTKNTLLIVPGSIFDVEKNRCGYGGGYYDTYIDKYKITNSIGICYDLQLIKSIPTGEFDKKLSKIITETKTIY